MVDPGTGMIGLGIALGAKDLLGKVLGPTADYAGERTREVVKSADENVRRILAAALRRLGGRSEGPEAVPPRVIKGLLTEGPFCDDELTAEYFGGVLASSRSGNPRDDRGAALMSLLGRMTTYQVRAHFLIYMAIRSAVNAEERSEIKMGGLHAFIPLPSFEEGMAFSVSEDRKALLGHSVAGLVREGLVDNGPLFGEEEVLRSSFFGVSGPGIVVGPSLLGAELFLWAHGRGDVASEEFLDSDVSVDNTTGLDAPDGAVIVEKRPTRAEGALRARESAIQQQGLMQSVAEEAARNANTMFVSNLAWQLQRRR